MAEMTTSLKGLFVTEGLLDAIGYTESDRSFIYNQGSVREDHLLGMVRSLHAYFLALGIDADEDELRCAVISLISFENGEG